MIGHVEQKSVSQVLPDDKIIYKIPKYQRKDTWDKMNGICYSMMF